LDWCLWEGSVFKFDDNARHVVGAESVAGVDIRRHNAVEHLLHNTGVRLPDFPLLNQLPRHLDSLLRCKAVPDSVAREDQKLIVVLSLHTISVWHARDHLLLDWQVTRLLVLKVAKCTRQTENASDTALFNKAAGSLDTFSLFDVVRFVVVTEFVSGEGAAKDTATVAGISTVDVSLGDNSDNGSASRRHRNGNSFTSFHRCAIGSPDVIRNLFDFIQTFLRLQKLVHSNERLLESICVLASFVGLKGD